MKNTSFRPLNKGQVLAIHKAAKKAVFKKYYDISPITVGKMKVVFGIGPDNNKYFCVY